MQALWGGNVNSELRDGLDISQLCQRLDLRPGSLYPILVFCLGIFPVLGLPFAVIGAGLAALITRPPAVAQAPPDGPTTSR